jgi:Transposase DDE domain group 1
VGDCATQKTRFETTPLALEAAFDGGKLTSDGGLIWLAKADEELGVCEEIASHVPEWRKGPSVRHPLVRLIRQRVLQIACGYEDQNDSDTLRSDPLLKLACGRLPETDGDLASQPTVSRLENAPNARACLRMAEALGELYVRERTKDGAPPERILLDFDATDDPAHGEQEGAYYHGYYQEHILHPLLVFDGDTGQLITTILRHGNTHASRGALSILKRVVRRLRGAWGEEVHIEIRADAGFAVPEIYEFCEQEGIGYTIGLISNPRLQALAEDLLERAKRESEEGAGEKVRLVSSGSYRAGTWEHARRVIYKAEVLEKGTNTRFVVTSRSDWPEELYNWYVRRGEAEGWIKDFKRALKADRLSCHRFFANQFRLLLHVAAYWLLDALRRKLVEAGVRRMQLDTLRLLLIKIGGRVRQLLTKVRLHLASGHPGQRLWHVLSPADPELAHE